MEHHTDISEPSIFHYILLFPFFIILRIWQKTIRMRAYDERSLEALQNPKRIVGLGWHNRIFFLPMCKYVFRPNLPMAGLVSASRDGAYLCALFKFMGIATVRGSSKRRGARAIISMIKTIRNTSDIFITPDGPQGPRYECKSGFLSVARISGSRILLMKISSSSFWTIRATWDKFILPKPFSRATVEALDFDTYDKLIEAAQAAGKTPEQLVADFLCSGETDENI